MFQDDEIYSLLTLAIAAYLFYMWLGDFRHFRKIGTVRRGAFVGATTVSLPYCFAAAAAAAAMLAIHIFQEYACGVESKQTAVSFWAIFSWCSAAFVEELIFRGYLVVQNRGRIWLWGSIVLFSVIFAAGHPFVWNYEVPEGASVLSGVWSVNFTLQPILSTLAIFECSLLFYVLRFLPANKNRSLIPCIAAHLTYNVGVFATKAFQGFVSW